MTRTVGVEEELLLVDAASGGSRALSSAVLAIAEKDAVGESAFEPELHRRQLEFSTHPCTDMEDRLVHPRTLRPEPAPDVLRALLDHVRDALEDSGDLEAAERALVAVERRGNGARIQREVRALTGNLRDTVAACVRITAA